MNKIFSHKVTLQIISIVLMILLVNSFVQNRNLNKYLYKRLDRDLENAIAELRYTNEKISRLYMDGDFETDYKISTSYIIDLDRANREIKKIFNISGAAFQWDDLIFIKWNIHNMKDKGYLTKEDEEYLKSIHSYNKRLIEAYYEILEKNKIDRNSFNKDYGKIKKVYKEFIAEANKMAMEKEYKKTIRYNIDEEETETEENNEDEKLENNVSLKEAEQLAAKVLEKLFHEKAILIEDEDAEQDEYKFYNKWEDGKDKNLYHISIGKEDDSFMMYKRSQLVTKPFAEEDLDNKAREIRDIFVPENYVCYEKKKKFDEGKLEEIEYKFIKKINDVYDESHVIEIEINVYGALSGLFISDPNNRQIDIEEPKLTKKDIISKITRGKVDHVILVKNADGQLQYRIFIELNEEIYTYTFHANTGEKGDFRKSDKMYFERVDDM